MLHIQWLSCRLETVRQILEIKPWQWFKFGVHLNPNSLLIFFSQAAEQESKGESHPYVIKLFHRLYLLEMDKVFRNQ